MSKFDDIVFIIFSFIHCILDNELNFKKIRTLASLLNDIFHKKLVNVMCSLTIFSKIFTSERGSY